MRGNDKLKEVIATVSGPMPADNLLEKIKEVMLKENAFKSLFGDKGERLNVGEKINLSRGAIPFMQLRHQNDSFPHDDGHMTGNVEGRILLPTGYAEDFGTKRQVGLLLYRYFQSDNFLELFNLVDGLTMIENLRLDYSTSYLLNSNQFPAILFTFSYRVDLHTWKIKNPQIDWAEPLDGAEFNIESYGITIAVDDGQSNELSEPIKDEHMMNLEGENND